MLTLSKAKMIVDHAIRRAEEVGIHVSVAVCDKKGRLIALNQMDGSSKWEADRSCIGVAVAASVTGHPSDQLSEQLRQGSAQFSSYSYAASPRGQRGGLPIFEHGVLQGGCGVSGGATAEQDEECAKAGIAALAEMGAESSLTINADQSLISGLSNR
jgi:glc operon protein GlcG